MTGELVPSALRPALHRQQAVECPHSVDSLGEGRVAAGEQRQTRPWALPGGTSLRLPCGCGFALWLVVKLDDTAPILKLTNGLPRHVDHHAPIKESANPKARTAGATSKSRCAPARRVPYREDYHSPLGLVQLQVDVIARSRQEHPSNLPALAVAVDAGGSWRCLEATSAGCKLVDEQIARGGAVGESPTLDRCQMRFRSRGELARIALLHFRSSAQHAHRREPSRAARFRPDPFLPGTHRELRGGERDPHRPGHRHRQRPGAAARSRREDRPCLRPRPSRPSHEPAASTSCDQASTRTRRRRDSSAHYTLRSEGRS
jgi:hypothetical protein